MTLHDDARSPRTRSAARGLLSALGAAAAGLAASACCWLPLVALATGASFGGAAAFLERFRPLLGGVALAALAAGFFVLYVAPRLRRRAAASDDRACGASCASCDQPSVLVQAAFWIAAAVVVASLSLPRWTPAIAAQLQREQPAGAASAVQAPDASPAAAQPVSGKAVAPAAGKAVRQLTLRVEGMTCAACAVGLEAQLRTIPGVRAARVDSEDATATLQLESSEAERRAIDVVTKMGYTARPVAVDESSAPDR